MITKKKMSIRVVQEEAVETRVTRKAPYGAFRKEVLQWLSLLGSATTEQLSLALGLTTEGRKVHLRWTLRRLVEQGVMTRSQSEMALRPVYHLGRANKGNLWHSLGVAWAKLFLELACRHHGYPHYWLPEVKTGLGIVPDALMYFEKPDSERKVTPRLMAVEYAYSREPQEKALGKFARYAENETHLKASYGTGQIYVLGIFAATLGQDEAWVRRLAKKLPGWLFYLAPERKFLSLLRANRTGLFVERLWYRQGGEITPIFLKG